MRYDGTNDEGTPMNTEMRAAVHMKLTNALPHAPVRVLMYTAGRSVDTWRSTPENTAYADWQCWLSTADGEALPCLLHTAWAAATPVGMRHGWSDGREHDEMLRRLEEILNAPWSTVIHMRVQFTPLPDALSPNLDPDEVLAAMDARYAQSKVWELERKLSP